MFWRTVCRDHAAARSVGIYGVMSCPASSLTMPRGYQSRARAAQRRTLRVDPMVALRHE